MTIAEDSLYALLPAVYREQDAQQGEPLRQLLQVLTDELAVVADSVDQLYDDLFVETAASWVLPYLAELIGLRGLPSESGKGITPRAEVANTIGYRRRKGTAAVLEQVSRDVTGWPARVVEYFELLATTQHVNHVRPANLAVAQIRDSHRLEYLGSPFERLHGQPDLVHTLDVRRIASGRGRYNVTNIGVFLWRLRSYSLTASPAVPAQPDDARRFHIHPLGVTSPLFTLPIGEDEITRLAEPINVPHVLGRRELHADLHAYYGPGLSIHIADVPASAVDVCDLSDVTEGGTEGWAHLPRPTGRVAIDPKLGRIAFGDDQQEPPLVSFHYGFGANLGGGEYDRADTFSGIDGPVERVSDQDPAMHQSVEDGLETLSGNGIVEIVNSGRYPGLADLVVDSRSIEIRGADRRRPTLVLDDELVIDGDGEGELTLNGLLIVGGTIRVRRVRALRLVHCTLVPGITLDADGSPAQPGVPSVVIEAPGTTLTIERSMVGPLRVHVDAVTTLSDVIVDAGEEGEAYISESSDSGGRLTMHACTVLGKVRTREIGLISDSIFLAGVTSTDDPDTWPGPVLVDRRQAGCVRFSYLPEGARTPRRHRCQPAGVTNAARVRPVLTSQRFPDAAYGQLDHRSAHEIRRGADDESEMGVFQHLYQPQRIAYLEARLHDYLRLGFELGASFAT
jgi:hypothetical protein